MIDDTDIPSILLDSEHTDDIQTNCSKCKSEINDSNKNESCDTLQHCDIHNTSIEPDANMMQDEIHQKNIGDESCFANDNKLLQDQAALDRRQNMIGDPLPSV